MLLVLYFYFYNIVKAGQCFVYTVLYNHKAIGFINMNDYDTVTVRKRVSGNIRATSLFKGMHEGERGADKSTSCTS